MIFRNYRCRCHCRCKGSLHRYTERRLSRITFVTIWSTMVAWKVRTSSVNTLWLRFVRCSQERQQNKSVFKVLSNRAAFILLDLWFPSMQARNTYPWRSHTSPIPASVFSGLQGMRGGGSNIVKTAASELLDSVEEQSHITTSIQERRTGKDHVYSLGLNMSRAHSSVMVRYHNTSFLPDLNGCKSAWLIESVAPGDA